MSSRKLSVGDGEFLALVPESFSWHRSDPGVTNSEHN